MGIVATNRKAIPTSDFSGVISYYQPSPVTWRESGYIDVYYENGKEHRLDGPSFVPRKAHDREFYINGNKYAAEKLVGQTKRFSRSTTKDYIKGFFQEYSTIKPDNILVATKSTYKLILRGAKVGDIIVQYNGLTPCCIERVASKGLIETLVSNTGKEHSQFFSQNNQFWFGKYLKEQILQNNPTQTVVETKPDFRKDYGIDFLKPGENLFVDQILNYVIENSDRHGVPFTIDTQQKNDYLYNASRTVLKFVDGKNEFVVHGYLGGPEVRASSGPFQIIFSKINKTVKVVWDSYDDVVKNLLVQATGVPVWFGSEDKLNDGLNLVIVRDGNGIPKKISLVRVEAASKKSTHFAHFFRNSSANTKLFDQKSDFWFLSKQTLNDINQSIKYYKKSYGPNSVLFEPDDSWLSPNNREKSSIRTTTENIGNGLSKITRINPSTYEKEVVYSVAGKSGYYKDLSQLFISNWHGKYYGYFNVDLIPTGLKISDTSGKHFFFLDLDKDLFYSATNKESWFLNSNVEDELNKLFAMFRSFFSNPVAKNIKNLGISTSMDAGKRIWEIQATVDQDLILFQRTNSFLEIDRVSLQTKVIQAMKDFGIKCLSNIDKTLVFENGLRVTFPGDNTFVLAKDNKVLLQHWFLSSGQINLDFKKTLLRALLENVPDYAKWQTLVVASSDMYAAAKLGLTHNSWTVDGKNKFRFLKKGELGTKSFSNYYSVESVNKTDETKLKVKWVDQQLRLHNCFGPATTVVNTKEFSAGYDLEFWLHGVKYNDNKEWQNKAIAELLKFQPMPDDILKQQLVVESKNPSNNKVKISYLVNGVVQYSTEIKDLLEFENGFDAARIHNIYQKLVSNHLDTLEASLVRETATLFNEIRKYSFTTANEKVFETTIKITREKNRNDHYDHWQVVFGLDNQNTHIGDISQVFRMTKEGIGLDIINQAKAFVMSAYETLVYNDLAEFWRPEDSESNQYRVVKSMGESIDIYFEDKLLLKIDTVEYPPKYKNTAQILADVDGMHTALKEEIKDQKIKKFWGIAAKGGTAVAGGLLAGVLKKEVADGVIGLFSPKKKIIGSYVKNAIDSTVKTSLSNLLGNTDQHHEDVVEVTKEARNVGNR